MNSLQLVSKIKSKAEDISHNIHQILDPGLSLNTIQKELLKKQCLDLYELLMKLKSESEETESMRIEDKIVSKNFYAEVAKPIEKVPQDAPVAEVVESEVPPIPEPNIKVDNFKEVLNWADNNKETLDSIEKKAEASEEKIEISRVPVVETKSEPVDHPIEVNLEKATENKRIQYTVMPTEETKPANLNANFVEKEISYNEKIAQKIQPSPIPLADKTIEAPIDNLKTAINLNKKIAFVNELFRENVVEYAKAIDKLNTADDRNDALRIFSELRQNNQWQNTNELVQELEKLVKRRHS